MELRPHTKDCCNPIASLLLRVYFSRIATQRFCYFEYRDDRLKRSLHETSFVNRHINYIVSWKLKQISFFSETLQRKAQQIKDAVIVTKRVSGLLELMAGQLDHLASHTLAEANEQHENHPGIKLKKKTDQIC